MQNRRTQNVSPIIDFPFAILNSLFLIPGSPDDVSPQMLRFASTSPG